MDNPISFRDLIRNQKLKGPTDRNFSREKWDSAWLRVRNEAEQHVYDAGITFNSLLSDIREATTELYKEKFPGISLNRLLELYCCISNRDISVASKIIREQITAGESIHSLLMDNNPAGNPLSSEEISVGAVDGVQPAIRYCMHNLKNKVQFPTGKSRSAPISFIREEALLSNLYSSYEQYFQALIWGDYTYEKSGTSILIQQLASPDELALEVTNLRKSRSHIRNALFSSHPDATKLLHGRCDYIKVEFQKLTCKKFTITPIENAPPRLQAENAALILSITDATESFPSDLLTRTVSNFSFCMKEALEVLKHLSLIAKQLASKLIECDSEAFSTNQILNYLAQVERRALISAISKITGFSSSKSREIIDYLSFSGEPKQDLWSHPMIETRPGKLSFILAAAASPIMQRVLEHWLTESFSNDDIKEKGKTYEQAIANLLNKTISSNKLVTDFSPALSANITTGEKKEEIDLLFRIGSLILIGELKSIITSDNPLSHFRAHERLKHGAAQARRKSQFIESHLNLALNQINWDVDPTKQYTILPIVISSNKTFSGFPIDGVPIVDEAILRSYLGQETFPLVSYYDVELQKTVTTAQYRLYDTFEQLQENLMKFLLLPPAIEGESENFINKATKLPGTSHENETIEFSRLVYKELADANTKLNRSKNFPIEKTSQHDELVKTVHTIC